MRTARRVHSRPCPSLQTTGLEPAQGVVQAPASRVEMPSLLPSAHPPSRGRYTDCNARRLRPYVTSGCHPAVGIAVATAFPPGQGSQGTVRTVLPPARRRWYYTTTEEGDVCLSYRIISSDNHVFEPADLWTTRAESKFRDRAPRVAREEDGDWWYCDNHRVIGHGRRRPDGHAVWTVGSAQTDHDF